MAAKSSDYRMAIKIAGEIDKSLHNSVDLTTKELNKIARAAAYASGQTKNTFAQGLRETEPLFSGLEKAGVKTMKTIVTASAAAGTAIIGIGTASAKAGMEFESAFAGVKKTTDATAEEYAQMREEILSMTREMPAAGTEIAGVAEAAGQLGIEKENLMKFSKTMIGLGESTNLSAEESASSLAKFANITNMEAENYDRLGSTIVDLGNNFATTEADIVAMSMRLASSGEMAGFSEPQIMAMATAMSSVGIEAEAGGSSMSKMIKKVQVAVETGNKSLKDYAKVAGMSVDEFKEAFQKDGLTAVAAFISGLNDIDRNGKSATVILDEMGLKETRLSNTLTSLANADDLMYEAVTTANTAWEENLALAKETATRYETTESKLFIMKNGFTEMGIAVSDQFNGPLREGIDVITELVHEATEEVKGSTVIHDIAQDIVDGIPTAVRVMEQMAETVGDFAQPFLSVGGWLAKNPKLLTSTIAGIGTSIVTYKVASGVMSLASAFTALGPAALPVLGLTGATAIISGVGIAVKKSAQEAKKANLDKHFGNITLSMQEMENVAAYIVSNNSFGQLQESIDGLRELDGINDSIEDSVSELNRMNWKISIGMDLREDERELYKQNIEDYVKEVQNYIEKEQYSINLSVGVLTGEELENSNIVTQLNEFYSGKNEELEELGKKLNETVTEAFNDDLLTIDEAENIAKLQRQIADIKASLATGNYEANLDLLGMKYSAGELDAESFMNLQAEINKQMEAAKELYDESYTASNSAMRAALEDGSMSREQYDRAMQELNAGYGEQVGGLEQKAVSFQTRFIRQNYEEEIGDYIDNTPEALGKMKEHMKEMDTLPSAKLEYEVYKNVSGIKNIDSSTIAAMGELWEELKPEISNLQDLQQEYMDAGKEIPQYITQGIDEGLAIGLMSGDKNILNEALGQQSIEQNYKPVVEETAKNIKDTTEQAINAVFATGIEVETFLNINYKNPRGLIGTGINVTSGLITADLGGHKEGGIFNTPHIAQFAEEGPEAAIPIDGSQNAINLWQQTGKMLGVYNRKDGFSALSKEIMGNYGSSASGGGTVNNSEEENKFSYSPTYNFYGDAPSKKDLDEHVEESFEKWEEMMNRWIKDNKRYEF